VPPLRDGIVNRADSDIFARTPAGKMRTGGHLAESGNSAAQFSSTRHQRRQVSAKAGCLASRTAAATRRCSRNAAFEAPDFELLMRKSI
jgi:hypothetical protein